MGAYPIVVIEESNPDRIVAIRKSSPLVIGVGDNEFFLASDASPIVEYTKHVIYLEDLELATIKNMSLSIKSNDENAVDPIIERLEFELEEIEKGGFDHFMLKEIFE